MTIFTATATMLREADPFRPIARVPEVRLPDPRMMELASKEEWTREDWAYALAREAEREIANPETVEEAIAFVRGDQSNISQENEHGATA